MRVKFAMGLLGILGASLLGWAALAFAQQSVPDLPRSPVSGPTYNAPAPLPAPAALPLPATAPNAGTALPEPASAASPAPLPLPAQTNTAPVEMPMSASSQPGTEDKGQDSAAPSDVPIGRQEPAVSLEWIGPPGAKLGQSADYSLMVRNTSNIPVQQVMVRVRAPASMKVNSAEPRCLNENNVLVWELGTLMPRQDKILLMKMSATAKGDLMPQAWITFTGSSVIRVRVREPKLILKAACPEKIMVGDAANVSLTVSNPGDGSADQVKIHAVLTDGLEHAKGSKIDFDVGNLAPGESRSVQLLCAAKLGGAQKCEAVAEAEGGLTSRDAAPITVMTPSIDLTLSGPGLRYLGRKALYALKVTNPGDAPATNVTVGDVVPEGFKVLAASDGGRHDFSTRTVSWFLGEVGPGQTREVKFEVEAINAGEHRHHAMATGARGLRAEAEMVTRVEGLSALLLEMVDTEDPIEAGGETGYEIRVTNTGSKTETDIRLVASIPDKMDYKDAKAPVKHRVEGKTIYFEPLEKLAPRADAIFRINVKALEPGTVRFKIQMTSTNLQEPVIKMEATRIYSDAPEGGSSRSMPQSQPQPQPQAQPQPLLPAPSATVLPPG